MLLICSCKNRSNQSNETVAAAFYDSIINTSTKNLSSLSEVHKVIDSSYASIPEISDAGKMSKYLFFCNIYYNLQPNYLKAWLYADSMMQLVNTNKDKEFQEKYLAVAQYSIGDASFGMKKYNEAYSYYYAARLTAEKNNDNCALHNYSYRLGMVKYKQQHYADAANYFKSSLQEIEYCDTGFFSFYRKQELLNNTALSFFKNNQYDSSLQYYQQGLEFIQANKKLVGTTPLANIAIGVIYGNMAQVYQAKGITNKAEELFKTSININSKEAHDNKDAQFAMINLSNLYLADKNLNKVLPVIQQLQTSLSTVKNAEAELQMNEVLWKYYDKLNQPSVAYQYYKKYEELKDAKSEKDKAFLQIDVDQQLKGMEKQYEIDLLKKHNDYQKIFIIVSLIGALMTFVIFLLIIKHARRNRKHIAQLRILNADINEKKVQLNETLHELKKQIEAKDRILKIVAHDLRTPIHGIAGLTGILLEEQDLNANQTQLLSLIQSSCNDANQLISEILEVAGLAEVKKLAMKPTDINAVVTDAVELLQFKASEKNQQILIETSKEPKKILINREKISRVISNLISNSIKFSPANEPIHISTHENNEGVLILVKDKGIGIPAVLKDTVFDVFTSAKRPGTSGEKSYGLGLSICRQIIEAHNGKIWFESEPGNGTTFYVEISAS